MKPSILSSGTTRAGGGAGPTLRVAFCSAGAPAGIKTTDHELA